MRLARDRMAADAAHVNKPPANGRSGVPVRRFLPLRTSWQSSNVRAVDEPPVLALEDLPVAMQFADVEPVVQNVRQRRAVESWLAWSVDVPLGGQLVGKLS